MKKMVSVLAAACLVVLVCGCNSPKPILGAGVFDSRGIPQKKYLVGGGLEVDYEVPVDGTVYWVEEHSGRILISESLEEGDSFQQSLPLELELIKLFGEDNAANQKMSLYFVPNPVEKEKTE